MRIPRSLQDSAAVRLFLLSLLIVMGLPGSANAGSMTLLGVGGPAAGGGAVTLNPANKSAAIVLSNGNLTASNSNASNTDASVKSTTSHSTGKFYFEVTITSSTRSTIGVGNASATLTGFVGSDANGIGAFDATGGCFVGGSPAAACGIAFQTPGTVFEIALDLTNGNIWGRVLGGNWNNNGTANPATNTGGNSLSGLGVGAGPYFATLSPANTGTVLVINFGATAYSDTPPAGFGNW